MKPVERKGGRGLGVGECVGGRRGRGQSQRSIHRKSHGENIAESDVEMSESQQLEEMRKTREQGLWVKSSFILYIFIAAN